MAITSLEVFNAFARRTAGEAIAQQIALFNAATRGGLTLQAATTIGDYVDLAFKKRISGLVRRRNAYGSGSSGTAAITEDRETSVRVAGGTPAIALDPSSFDWTEGRQRAEGIVFGQQLAEDTMADMLNVALAAVTAALETEATNLYDGTGANLSLSALNSGSAKLGDRAASIACWVAHSKPMHDLYGAALANANFLFDFGTVRIVNDGFGRPIIMTDSTSLVYTSGGTKYRTVGLIPGGITVTQNNDFREAIVEAVGTDNITANYQAQWTYLLGLKGFSWDKSNGGPSPSNAALATGTNWDKVATSAKDLPGTLVLSL